MAYAQCFSNGHWNAKQATIIIVSLTFNSLKSSFLVIIIKAGWHSIEFWIRLIEMKLKLERWALLLEMLEWIAALEALISFRIQWIIAQIESSSFFGIG